MSRKKKTLASGFFCAFGWKDYIGAPVKDEIEGLGRGTAVKFDEVGEGRALLEGDDGKQSVAREGQIESGLGPSMRMPVFLPSGGVVPRLRDGGSSYRCSSVHGRSGRIGIFFRPKAGEEDEGMALGCFWFFPFARVALHCHRKAGAEHSGNDRSDGFHRGFAGGPLPRSPSVLRSKRDLSRARRDLPSAWRCFLWCQSGSRRHFSKMIGTVASLL